MDLLDELKSQLPVPFYLSRDLSQTLSQKGLEISPETELMVTKVLDGGDMAGIMCVIEWGEQEPIVTSITLLRAEPGHPLADKITEYQRRRLRKLFRSRGLSRRGR
jgi:hypothetical protein